jgi:hypothetical protein
MMHGGIIISDTFTCVGGCGFNQCSPHLFFDCVFFSGVLYNIFLGWTFNMHVEQFYTFSLNLLENMNFFSKLFGFQCLVSLEKRNGHLSVKQNLQKNKLFIILNCSGGSKQISPTLFMI